MLEFQKNRRVQKMIYSKISLAFVLILLLVIAHLIYDFNKKFSESKERRAMAEREFSRLEERKVNLAKKIEHLDSKTGREEELRNRFNVSKEGESIVMILDEDKDDFENATSTKTTTGFWGKIKSLFDF